MGFTFHCLTQIIILDDARGDLAHALSEFPNGKIFMLTDAGVLHAGVATPLIQVVEQCAREAIVFSDIPGNPNVSDVSRALDALQDEKPVAIVAIGGGSVIDTAKAVGILINHENADWEDLQWGRAPVTNFSVPVIAIPTTAAAPFISRT